MARGVRYVRSYYVRALTRLPAHRRRTLRRIAGRGEVMVTGAPPTSGLVLRGFRLDQDQAWGLVRGRLEPAVQEAFRRHVAAGSVVWDVGANVGYFSLLAVRLGATVHAFEPVPENAATLEANVAANAMGDRITVHPVAVAAQEGRQTLLVVDDPSWSHLADRGRHARSRERVDVEVVTLDALGLPAPDLIKIDVEGSEVAVLEGARRLLSEQRPRLVVELHETNDEVCDLLGAAGYRVENLDGPAPVREAGPVHILATPEPGAPAA